jgi:hypothetical protein
MPKDSNRKDASRRYYEKHREEILSKRKKYRSENQDLLSKKNRARRKSIQEYVLENKCVPCADCGVSYPTYVMDFDHIRGIKIKSVARMVADGVSLEALQSEIDKCEVVCSNCHRERTHVRRQSGSQVQDRATN